MKLFAEGDSFGIEDLALSRNVFPGALPGLLSDAEDLVRVVFPPLVVCTDGDALGVGECI